MQSTLVLNYALTCHGYYGVLKPIYSGSQEQTIHLESLEITDDRRIYATETGKHHKTQLLLWL